MDEVKFEKKIKRANRSSQLSDREVTRVHDLVGEWESRYGDAEDIFIGLVLIAENDLDSESSISSAGERIAKLVQELDAARSALRTEMRLGSMNGLPETRIAELAGVNRHTVRAALGK